MKTGVLLVGFGGPRSLDEVAPMLEAVMGVTPPPPMVASATHKYEAIGGSSPVVPIALEICLQLYQVIKHLGGELAECVQHVATGMCFTPPSIREGLQELVDAGCERVVFLSMTPFESWAAWAGPCERVRTEASALGIDTVVCAPVFGTSEHYIHPVAHLVSEGLHAPPDALIFVAHSLPLDDEKEDARRYESQLQNAVGMVTEALRIPRGLESLPPISLAYTSIGARGGQWLGPLLGDELTRLAQSEVNTVLVSPLGFATDHMEVLYDLDIEAKSLATDLDVQFVRLPTLAGLASDSKTPPISQLSSWVERNIFGRLDPGFRSHGINPFLIMALYESLERAVTGKGERS